MVYSEPSSLAVTSRSTMIIPYEGVRVTPLSRLIAILVFTEAKRATIITLIVQKRTRVSKEGPTKHKNGPHGGGTLH